MLKIFTITRINIILIVSVIILSFLTIIWHNQSRLLYKKTKSVQQANQAIMAKKKQLQSEHSEQISGNKIKQKAVKILHMQQPVKLRGLSL